MDSLSKAVKTAIENAPCSSRALASEAGVPASTLHRIANGERAATHAVATNVADALERWAKRTQEEAERIRLQLGGNDE